jgi:hypothetical protein
MQMSFPKASILENVLSEFGDREMCPGKDDVPQLFHHTLSQA